MKNKQPDDRGEPRPYIILIDDDEDDLEILSSSLERMDVRTKSFSSGNKALFYLNLLSDTCESPELIITDYNMPGMNGRQVLNVLKSDKATNDIPVVIFSTHMSPVFKNALMELGAYDCFAKPSNYAGMNEQVNTFKEMAAGLMKEGPTCRR